MDLRPDRSGQKAKEDNANLTTSFDSFKLKKILQTDASGVQSYWKKIRMEKEGYMATKMKALKIPNSIVTPLSKSS